MLYNIHIITTRKCILPRLFVSCQSGHNLGAAAAASRSAALHAAAATSAYISCQSRHNLVAAAAASKSAALHSAAATSAYVSCQSIIKEQPAALYTAAAT